MDYKNTVFLPKTPFSMKAKLPSTEPVLLAKWQQEKIYQKIQKKHENGPTFFLHDGPPYANGHLHMGHALNKILKDTVIKYHNLLGFRAPYTPGWDCHGLPIEWMVESNFKKAKKDKAAMSPTLFRSACREFAKKWVKIQADEFQRLGIFGNWEKPYLTMDRKAEATISKELLSFLMNGGLYKGVKPVYWSVVEKTALAEAEVEYKDKTSPSVYVTFPVVETSVPALKGAHAIIWTTTPWTLPGNRAVAYAEDVSYEVVKINKAPADEKLVGMTLIVATPLLAKTMAAFGDPEFETITTLTGADLEGTICHHPWHGQGYDFAVPLLPGDHVTTEQGTGLVHTAPGHGVEDFQLGHQFDLEVAQPVGDDGVYYDHVPLWAGHHVYKVNDLIVENLQASGNLFGHTNITHSYPHSWRSKAPLIYRTTPQWFISMDANDLRAKALAAIESVEWVPKQGENRIRAMVKSRPDWCISRQRSWGIPLPLFVHKQTGEPLKDPVLNARILDHILKHGCDTWFEDGVAEGLLAPEHDPAHYEKCQDILDVWFESGCSYSFALEDDQAAPYSNDVPVDLCLEGSDQHRGWFQSTLLESVGTRGVPPYKSVLTHGFVVDHAGYKLSKSAGNAVTLEEIVSKHGADVLRLWVIGSDYMEDLKIGKDILKHQEDIYRRLRNTLRYLLGNIQESVVENPGIENLPLLERWVLSRLAAVMAEVKHHIKAYDLHALFKVIYTFCSVDLSAFYFDIRKDALYCDQRDSARYQSVQFVLQQVYEALTIALSPVLTFTAEEAWQQRHPESSVHLQDFPALPSSWQDEALGEKMGRLREIRRVITGALEGARMDKKIGSSLQAHVTVILENPEEISLFEGIELADFAITSSGEIKQDAISDTAYQLSDIKNVGVIVSVATGEKCVRCWRVLEEVGTHADHPELCTRCTTAIPSDYKETA